MHHSFAFRRQRGFTLVELMVAMAVGLLLLSALASLYANTSQSNVELEKSVRQIENGRHGVDLLREDITSAGYYGELPTHDLKYSVPDPCAQTLANLGWDTATTTVPVAVTGLTAAETAALTCLDNHRAGTPALVLRRVQTQAQAAASVDSESPYLQTSRCKNDPSTPRFLLEAKAAKFTLRTLDCGSANQVQRYLSRIYYVSNCNECGLDNTPTLKRAELRSGKIEHAPLAEGVEDVAFEFGFDTDTDGTVNTFLSGLSGSAGAADNDWSNVVGVRARLLSATTEPTPGFTSDRTFDLGMLGTRGPFTDKLKRRVYAMNGRLNNNAGPRERP